MRVDEHYDCNSPQRALDVTVVQSANDKHDDAIASRANKEDRPATTLFHEEQRPYNCEDSDTKAADRDIICMDWFQSCDDEKVDPLSEQTCSCEAKANEHPHHC